MPNLIKAPNMILISKFEKEAFGQQQAYFAHSWLRPTTGVWGPSSRRSDPASFGGLIEGAFWMFDGTFRKNVEQLNIGNLPSSSMTKEFSITDLSFYPIRYAQAGLEDALRARGTTFWRCRSKRLVSYDEGAIDGIQGAVCIL